MNELLSCTYGEVAAIGRRVARLPEPLAVAGPDGRLVHYPTPESPPAAQAIAAVAQYTVETFTGRTPGPEGWRHEASPPRSLREAFGRVMEWMAVEIPEYYAAAAGCWFDDNAVRFGEHVAAWLDAHIASVPLNAAAARQLRRLLSAPEGGQ